MLVGDEEADLARSQLKSLSTTHMFKAKIPNVDGSGSLTLIIPQPTMTRKPHLLVGHWTHACPAFDLVNEKPVMIMDSWRVSLPDSYWKARLTSCTMFPILQTALHIMISGMLNWQVPTCLSLHTLFTAWSLILWAKKLTHLKSTRQLTVSVRDALIAHKGAFELAKVLHQDLSVGNIVIYKGKGHLVDWDLAKLVNIQGPRQTTRTGTCQFMSAYLIEHSNATHMVEDDLESGLFVILWTALTICKETSVCRSKFNTDVFIIPSPGLFSRADWLIIKPKTMHVMFVDCKPLESLVCTLAEFFSHRYSQISDDERTAFDKLQLAFATMIEQSPTHEHLKLLEAVRRISPVYKKEMGMKVLHSHDAVIRILNEHLDLSDWSAGPRRCQPAVL